MTWAVTWAVTVLVLTALAASTVLAVRVRQILRPARRRRIVPRLTRRRVSIGDPCPYCHAGTVYPTHSPVYGGFLGCTMFDKRTGTGCRASWHPDGSRLRRKRW